MIKSFKKSDIGKIVIYKNGDKGKIKFFDDKMKVAWIVYKCSNEWDSGWKNYTAEATMYKDLIF